MTETRKPPPVVRDEKWTEAFSRQASVAHFVERMQVWARRRAQLVGIYLPVDDYYEVELVEDILVDTLEGRLTWDPARCDLARHVKQAIKMRTRHHYVHGEKFRHARIDQSDAAFAALEQHLMDRAEQEESCRRAADEWLEAYRKLAAGDREVLLLLDAYELTTEKAEVLQISGLSSRQYDAARERLRRLYDRLPHQLLPKRRG